MRPSRRLPWETRAAKPSRPSPPSYLPRRRGRQSRRLARTAAAGLAAAATPAGDLSLSGHSWRGAPTTGRWWPLDPGCSGRIWWGGTGRATAAAGDGEGGSNGGGEGDGEGRCVRRRPMVLAGGGDGVDREREGGCGDPCAATARFSAAVSPRSAPLGRIWRRRWWSRQLAAATTADDADRGLSGDVADGDSEAAAGSGGCSRRRWLASVAAATAADLPAAGDCRAKAQSWFLRVPTDGGDGFSITSLLEDVILASLTGRSRLGPFVGLVAVGHA
uniref:Uncharacterized protein n=1 Tax=Oryza barthii TaxID=65489 RepID=A0A0D3FNN6_9ORYZ